MMRRFTCILLFFITSSQLSNAQKASVTGTITDETSTPLFGATIAVFGKPYGTTADDKGHFNLEVPANQPLKIVVSFTGFKADTSDFTLKPGEVKTFTVHLKASSVQMKD